MSSLSLMTGFARGMDAASVRGDGHLDNLGGGILGRLDFRNTGSGRAYAEASARAGRANNTF